MNDKNKLKLHTFGHLHLLQQQPACNKFALESIISNNEYNNNNNNNNNNGKKDLLNLRRWEGRSFSVMQRVSVLVQRYNAILLRDTLPAPDCTDRWPVPSFVYLSSLIT